MLHVNSRHLEQPLTKEEDIGFNPYEDKLHLVSPLLTT